MIRICLFILALCGGCSFAQGQTASPESSRIRITSTEGSQADPWCLNRPEVRDTSYIDAIYRLDYIYDTAQRRSRTSRMHLQIGPSWIKYYGIRRELEDGLHTQRQSEKLPFGIVPNIRPSEDIRARQEYAGDRNINGEVWVYRPTGTRIVRYHHLERFDTALTYEEPEYPVRWELLPHTDSICGYQCHTARAMVGGRSWTVWYAPEIPLSYGPWKFSGLPGLILQAEDAAREFRWTCEQIATAKAPIVWYEVDCLKWTRKECLRYFKNYYASPFSHLRGGFSGNFRVVGSNGKSLDETWTIPYNPLELE